MLVQVDLEKFMRVTTMENLLPGASKLPQHSGLLKKCLLVLGAALVMSAVGCSPERGSDYYDSFRYERGQLDDSDLTHQEKVDFQLEMIRRQEEEIRRQDRELEDLRRQKYQNERLRKYQ